MYKVEQWWKSHLDRRREQRAEESRILAALADAAAAYVTPLLHLSDIEGIVLRRYVLAQLLAHQSQEAEAAQLIEAGRAVTLLREAFGHKELFTLSVHIYRQLFAHRRPESIKQLPAQLDELADQLLQHH